MEAAFAIFQHFLSFLQFTSCYTCSRASNPRMCFLYSFSLSCTSCSSEDCFTSWWERDVFYDSHWSSLSYLSFTSLQLRGVSKALACVAGKQWQKTFRMLTNWKIQSGLEMTLRQRLNPMLTSKKIMNLLRVIIPMKRIQLNLLIQLAQMRLSSVLISTAGFNFTWCQIWLAI